MEQAGKAVRQLGSLLFEMEVLRSFLETEAELMRKEIEKA